MKYIPAGIFAVIGGLFFLASLGDHQGEAMPATIMILPAGAFGLLAIVAGLIAYLI